MRKVIMTTVKIGTLITELNVARMKREKAEPVVMYSAEDGAKFSAVFFVTC